MVLHGVTIKSWIGEPSSILVVTRAGHAYWVESLDAADALADEVRRDTGEGVYIYSVEYKG